MDSNIFKLPLLVAILATIVMKQPSLCATTTRRPTTTTTQTILATGSCAKFTQVANLDLLTQKSATANATSSSSGLPGRSKRASDPDADAVGQVTSIISGGIELADSIVQLEGAKKIKDQLLQIRDRLVEIKNIIEAVGKATEEQRKKILRLAEGLDSFTADVDQQTASMARQLIDIGKSFQEYSANADQGFGNLSRTTYSINGQLIDIASFTEDNFGAVQNSIFRAGALFESYRDTLDGRITQHEISLKRNINQVDLITSATVDVHQEVVTVAANQQRQIVSFDSLLGKMFNVEAIVDKITNQSNAIGDALNVTLQTVLFAKDLNQQIFQEQINMISDLSKQTERMMLNSKIGRHLNRIEYLRYRLNDVLPLETSDTTKDYGEVAKQWASAVLDGSPPDGLPVDRIILELDKVIKGESDGFLGTQTKSLVQIYNASLDDLTAKDESQQSKRWYMQSMIDEMLALENDAFAMQMIAEIIKSNGPTSAMSVKCQRTTQIIENQKKLFAQAIGSIGSNFLPKDSLTDFNAVATRWIYLASNVSYEMEGGNDKAYPLSGCRFCFRCSNTFPSEVIFPQCSFFLAGTDGNSPNATLPQRVIDVKNNGELLYPTTLTTLNQLVPRSQQLRIASKANVSVLLGAISVDDPANELVCGISLSNVAATGTENPVVALSIRVCSRANYRILRIQSPPANPTKSSGFAIAQVEKISFQWVQPRPFGWITGVGFTTARSGVLEFFFKTSYQ